MQEEVKKEENYIFPWGIHLGDLVNTKETIPLYTPSSDGGLCLLYDKISERRVDTLLESLLLELLSTMPYLSLKVDLFDFGKKKFYTLSPLQYMQTYQISYTKEMIEQRFVELEDIVTSRHNELLCCARKDLNEHNQKSKMKQAYHILLINLENFPSDDISLRRVQNFVESSFQAGLYVIAFGYDEVLQSQNQSLQAIVNYFKNIVVKNNEFAINKKIFEFVELLEDHKFESLNLDKTNLLEKIMLNADLVNFSDPANIKLEADTKVKGVE